MLIDAHTLVNPEVLTQHLMAIRELTGQMAPLNTIMTMMTMEDQISIHMILMGGHNHDWKNGVRGPAYSIGWKPIAGVALVTVCVIGIVVVAANDVTGFGVADDFLFGPLGAGVREGLILIFG